MKAVIKTFGIFTVLAIIGLSVFSCKEDEGPPPLTGKVNIDGQAYAGYTLTANTNALGGSGTISFQWRLDGKDISGANNKTYIVQFADVNKNITVRVTRAGYTGAIVSESAYTALPPLAGTVTIDGIPGSGKTLTVNTDALGGSGTFFYQWRRNGDNISGANSKTYTVRSVDLNTAITASVTRAGFTGEVVSEPKNIILLLAGTVSIDGHALIGETLTANTNALEGSGTISYQWRKNGNEISGAADKTYIVKASDLNTSITVSVTRAGLAGEVISEPVIVYLLALTGTVTIEGLAQVGQTLTANTDALDGTGTLSYQWRHNENSISGAVNKTYLVQSEDEGLTLTVKVTRAGFEGEIISEPTDAVPFTLTGKVSIDGITRIGETLTANTGELNGSGAISYQWRRSGNNISGAADKTYLVQSADLGLTLTVRVTRADNTGEIVSEPTAAITLPSLTGTVSIEGSAAQGQLLTANTNALGGSGTISYQWMRNENNISGAAGNTYTLQSADVGYTVTVSVTRAGNSGEVISAATNTIIRPVTGITDVPAAGTAGIPLSLTGTVVPSDATYKTITWSILNAGTTGAAISGSTLSAMTTGTVTVRAEINNGLLIGTNYTQDFSISIVDYSQWVKRLNFTGTTETTATVNFINLKNHDIYLVKINTANSNVTAVNTGRVSSTAPSSEIVQSLTPQLSAIITNQTPVKGRPYANQFSLPQPVPYEPSTRPLYNFVPPVVGNTRTFWVDITPAAATANFQQQQAILLATGTYGNIWVVSNSITTTEAQAMAAKFDVIYPATTNIFGYEYGGRPGHPVPGGVDGDPKIQILVHPITGSGSNILGYFWQKDYYTKAQTGLESNQAEIFYINSSYVKTRPLMIYDTLTHEFQHMIHFNVKTVENGRNSSTWYNEMMSMISEDIISDLLPIPITDSQHVSADTIPYFNENYALEGFTDWNTSNIISNYWPYASKFTFGAYLVRNYGGAEFVRKLSANNSVDLASITAAINEMAPGTTFNEALIRFSEALVFSGSKTPSGVNTLDRTVSQTINGITYNAHAINIWDRGRGSITSAARGPVTYGLTQQLAMRPYSVSLHTDTAWQNKTGDFSVTLQRPGNTSVVYVLVAKER